MGQPGAASRPFPAVRGRAVFYRQTWPDRSTEWPSVTRLSCLLVLAACGGGGSTAPDASGDGAPPDGTSQCKPIGAQGQFTRRAGNPRMIAGATFTDGKQDVSLRDPDVRWDAASSRYHLYYTASHATSFTASDGVPVVRRATSADRTTWTVDDAPSLALPTDANAWDATHLEAPTVVYNPDAPADRRYLMLYAGAAGAFPHASSSSPHYAIGAAFSADGITFTRASRVLTGKQAYPTATDAIVSDPELALVNGVYHLWFSSFACTGTNCETVLAIGIGHATSLDGITWTLGEAPVRSLLRASADTKTGGHHPSVVYDADHCRYELWLTSDAASDTSAQPVLLDNMAGMYKAESTDGVSWSINYMRARDLLWSSTEPGEHLGLQIGGDVTQNSTGRLMLYVAYDDENVPQGATLPDRAQGTRAGVMTLQLATRDLP